MWIVLVDAATHPSDEETRERREVSRNEGVGSCGSYVRARDDKPRMSALHSRHRAPVSSEEPDGMDETRRSKTPFEPVSLASLAPLQL